MTNRPFDVVIVPDFAGRRAARFELRSLFFLASWLQYAGEARSFPLHVASIGTPPQSVRVMADRCGASVSQHEPMPPRGGNWNKLRGFEVSARTDRILLLDVDVLVLSDPSSLATLRAGEGISAAFSIKAALSRHWREVYARLGIERVYPETPFDGYGPGGRHRIVPLRAQDGVSAYPYYNAGVVFAPWQCGLGELWGAHLLEVHDVLERRAAIDPPVRLMLGSDQAALATSIELLKARGVAFSPLPPAFHATWRDLYLRAPALDGVRLLHAMRLFADCSDVRDASRGIVAFQRFLIGEYLSVWRATRIHGSRAADAWRCLLPALRDVVRLGAILRRLHARHVTAALE